MVEQNGDTVAVANTYDTDTKSGFKSCEVYILERSNVVIINSIAFNLIIYIYVRLLVENWWKCLFEAQD